MEVADFGLHSGVPVRIRIVPAPPSTGIVFLRTRAECAPLWHPRILPQLTKVRLTIFVGSFSFAANLGGLYRNLSEAAEDFRTLLPGRIVLPHPSPRNGMWARQRPWFAAELLPALRERVAEALRT